MTTMADKVAPMSSPALRKILIRAISFVMPLATLVLMAFFAVNTTAFLTFDNFAAIISQNAAVIIITAASAMLLMAGYIDLSIGSLMGLAGVVGGLAFLKAGVGVGIFSALAVGFGWGLMNGVLIGIFELSPIVVTLGGLATARGIALALAPKAVYGFPDVIVELGSGKFAWASRTLGGSPSLSRRPASSSCRRRLRQTHPGDWREPACFVSRRHPRQENNSDFLCLDRPRRRRRRSPDRCAP